MNSNSKSPNAISPTGKPAAAIAIGASHKIALSKLDSSRTTSSNNSAKMTPASLPKSAFNLLPQNSPSSSSNPKHESNSPTNPKNSPAPSASSAALLGRF